MKRSGLLTVLALTGVAATTLALAGNETTTLSDEERLAGAGARKIHMIAAIAIAESATRGRAVQAELEADGERLVYEVEVLVDRSMRTVIVDATTGEVRKS